MLNRDVVVRHNAADERASFGGSRGFAFELTDSPAAVANLRLRLFDVLVAVEPATVLR